MKIVLFANTTWNIVNFRMPLIDAFLKEGHQVEVLAPHDDAIEVLKSKGITFHTIAMENKGTNPVKDIFLLRDIFFQLKKIKPDLILTFTIKPNIYASIVCDYLNIPCVCNVSGLGTVFLHDNFSSQIAKKLYRFAFKKSAWVFFQNPDDRNLFIEKKLVSPEKSELLPGSGVNLNYFSPSYKTKSSPFHFLMVARLLKDKGTEEFAKAAELFHHKYPNQAVFTIVGDWNADDSLYVSRDQLNQWIQNNSIFHIPFQKDIRKYIQEAHVVVLPSYREGTPKAMLEAAASAKPLIATNVPGCKEVIQEGNNGYLCQVKDPQSLFVQFEKLFSSSDETLHAMALQSRRMAEEKFDEKKVQEIYIRRIRQWE